MVLLLVFLVACGKQSEKPSLNTKIERTIDQENTEFEELEVTEIFDDKDQEDLDTWGVDWGTYKTFDGSELLNVSKFTFNVISSLSDNPNPLFDVTRGIGYTYTSTDSIMTNNKTERHQLQITIGNPNNSQTDMNFYNGDEKEIINRFDDFVKNGMGSTMYDDQFSKKGNYKMFTYKYVGDPLTKCTITGRIYLANENDSIPTQNTSNPDRKYNQKWIEITYTSPQIAESAKSEVLDKEIEQFDKFFDDVIESLIIED